VKRFFFSKRNRGNGKFRNKNRNKDGNDQWKYQVIIEKEKREERNMKKRK
jgi:hypothetical protein